MYGYLCLWTDYQELSPSTSTSTLVRRTATPKRESPKHSWPSQTILSAGEDEEDPAWNQFADSKVCQPSERARYRQIYNYHTLLRYSRREDLTISRHGGTGATVNASPYYHHGGPGSGFAPQGEDV